MASPPPMAAISTNPFDMEAAAVSSQAAAVVAPPPAAEEDADAAPTPESCPADLLRVILRHAEPGAKEFVRSLRLAEDERTSQGRRPSVVSLVLPTGRERAATVAGSLSKGTSSGGNLFSKLSRQASKLKEGVDTKVKALAVKK